ncbi:MAG TPA: hypothetical protein VFX03_10395, partial [Thermomicrobiales bacterium]|nr:hypothetical protein [Thermomicrobiales bacterium]
MDPSRFDALVASLARPGSRRRLLGGVLAGSFPTFAAAAADASRPDVSGPRPAKCLAVGKRCTLHAAARHGKKGNKGKHHPPSCAKCCSRYSAPGANGNARCACKSEGIACAGDDQCCSGQCRDDACTACPPNTV